MIVRRYLSRLLLLRVLGTLLSLAAILQLLDLLDQAGQIVPRGGVAAIGHYILLRMPSLLAGAVPLGVLAGALLCFNRLASGSEMVALRATGSSLLRIMLALLPACLMMAAIQLVLQAEIAPWSARALSNWWQKTTPANAEPPPARSWMRFGAELVAVTGVSDDGRDLSRLLIVHRTPDGDLRDRIDAACARFADGHWTLRDVTLVRPDGAPARHLETLPWLDGPTPANIIDVARPVLTLPIERLLGIVHGRWASGHGALAARTALDLLFLSLLDPLLMVLVASPLLLTPPRHGGNGLRMLRVVGLGLGYLGAEGLLSAMGNSGTLPPIVATALPPLLFGGIALVSVLQADAG